MVFNFKENTFKIKKNDGSEKTIGSIPEKLYSTVSKINSDFNFILGEIFHVIGIVVTTNITTQALQKWKVQ